MRQQHNNNMQQQQQKRLVHHIDAVVDDIPLSSMYSYSIKQVNTRNTITRGEKRESHIAIKSVQLLPIISHTIRHFL